MIIKIYYKVAKDPNDGPYLGCDHYRNLLAT